MDELKKRLDRMCAGTLSLLSVKKGMFIASLSNSMHNAIAQSNHACVQIGAY